MSAQDYITPMQTPRSLTQAIEQLMNARPDLNASIFDADKDGNVDNLLVIADLPKLPENISFTPHANTDPGATIVGSGNNKRTVRAITVLNGGGITSFDPSVAVHERLHTIGAADYYRGDGREGDPVSYWDVMAKGNSYSWPLAYTRERLGWVDIPEIQIGAAGTSLTLYAPGDSDDILGSKPQAAKIKLPLSTSEYFVIEYRKQGTGRDYNNPINNLDRYIGSSGLIVYRVNERYANQGNFRGNDSSTSFAGRGRVSQLQPGKSIAQPFAQNPTLCRIHPWVPLPSIPPLAHSTPVPTSPKVPSAIPMATTVVFSLRQLDKPTTPSRLASNPPLMKQRTCGNL